MDIFNRGPTEFNIGMENQQVNTNLVLDAPWSRIQQLLRESDSMIQSSLSQSQDSLRRDSIEDYRNEFCNNCVGKARENEEKLADLQQQLNVAVSSNYTKNVMIEQLDKTLSKIVDGWKKFETDKTNQMNKLEKERNSAKDDLKREQEVLIKVEKELTVTLDKLMLSQKEIEAIHRKKQIWSAEFEAKISKLTEDLTTAQNRNVELITSNKNLIDDYENKIREINNKISVQSQEWHLQEDKYITQIKNYTSKLNIYQQDCMKQEQNIKTLQLQLQLTSNQLDDILREKESLKVEVSLLQARNTAEKNEMEEKEKDAIELVKRENERNLIQLEQKLRVEYENKMKDIENRFQKSLDQHLQKKAEDAAKERESLQSEYEKALNEQIDRFDQELELKETEIHRRYRSKDESIQELVEQVKQLKIENAKLSSNRSHIMSRIQDLLQNQWQESLRILYGTSDATKKLNLSTLNLAQAKELDFFFSDDVPTPDYDTSIERLHSCKTQQFSNLHNSIMNRNDSLPSLVPSFKSLPSKPSLEKNLFDDLFPRVEKGAYKDDLKLSHDQNQNFVTRDARSEKFYDLPPKGMRKAQSFIERISTPDEFSKMTECSESLTASEVFSEPVKRLGRNLGQKPVRNRNYQVGEQTQRHEDRQMELKNYLEKLLQRPPGEPVDEQKDQYPSRDDYNHKVVRRFSNFTQQPTKTCRTDVPRLSLPSNPNV